MHAPLTGIRTDTNTPLGEPQLGQQLWRQSPPPERIMRTRRSVASQRDDNTMNMSHESGNQSRTVRLWKFYRDPQCLTGGLLGGLRSVPKENEGTVRRSCPRRIVPSNRQELPES